MDKILSLQTLPADSYAGGVNSFTSVGCQNFRSSLSLVCQAT
jgi:hypothetical protein